MLEKNRGVRQSELLHPALCLGTTTDTDLCRQLGGGRFAFKRAANTVNMPHQLLFNQDHVCMCVCAGGFTRVW